MKCHLWVCCRCLVVFTATSLLDKALQTSTISCFFPDPGPSWIDSVLCKWALWFIHKCYKCGGFLKLWYPTTMGFPTKNDHFGVFRGYHHLRKHPCRYYNLDLSGDIQVSRPVHFKKASKLLQLPHRTPKKSRFGSFDAENQKITTRFLGSVQLICSLWFQGGWIATIYNFIST